MSLFKTEMGNIWAEICLDRIENLEHFKEVETILFNMFSFDKSISDEWYEKGYNRLKELGEYRIVECIDKKYYMMYGGVRE